MTGPCGEALGQRSGSFQPKGFGGRDTEAKRGSQGRLTAREMDPLARGHVNRAQSQISSESSHLEGKKWPASSDRQQRSRRGALAPWSWETPWQRAERYNPFFGVKTFGGTLFYLPCFSPPELEALMSSSDWKG